MPVCCTLAFLIVTIFRGSLELKFKVFEVCVVENEGQPPGSKAIGWDFRSIRRI